MGNPDGVVSVCDYPWGYQEICIFQTESPYITYRRKTYASQYAAVGKIRQKNDVKIIVADDSSTGQTGEIADLYAKWFPEVVAVVHKGNGGQASGVNTGLKLAKGRYFKVEKAQTILAL